MEYELRKPNIKEVSPKQLQDILSTFSNILPNVTLEKKKGLLHSIISKITVNEGNSPKQRSVKAFSCTLTLNYVLTCGKAPHD
jgi:site-specific DNA recombinase